MRFNVTRVWPINPSRTPIIEDWLNLGVGRFRGDDDGNLLFCSVALSRGA